MMGDLAIALALVLYIGLVVCVVASVALSSRGMGEDEAPPP